MFYDVGPDRPTLLAGAPPILRVSSIRRLELMRVLSAETSARGRQSTAGADAMARAKRQATEATELIFVFCLA